jgi:glycosyltransferase involved in cell wall biosynthesis
VILSVVMPSYNKCELLAQSLEALCYQDLAVDWEIVVVNDGSTDETESFLAAESRRSPRRLQVVRPNRNVGRAAARNLGVRAALGRWILFLDDDIVAPPGLLSAHLDRLTGTQRSGTIGCVLTAPDLVDAPHFHYLDTRGVAKVKGEIVPARYFVTQNAAVPREALLAIGGFDERFSAYGLEDMDLAFRLEDQQNITFLPVREPVPRHVHHHSLAQYLAKKKECGYGSLPLMAQVHPHRIVEMKLHWVIDPPGSPPPSWVVRLARRLAGGPFASALDRCVRLWPVRGRSRPFCWPLYYRCMDALVLSAYHQGLAEAAGKNAN